MFDSVLSQFRQRVGALTDIVSEFCFLTGHGLHTMTAENIRKHAHDLALKYSDDLDVVEFVSEQESFKFQASTLILRM